MSSVPLKRIGLQCLLHNTNVMSQCVHKVQSVAASVSERGNLWRLFPKLVFFCTCRCSVTRMYACMYACMCVRVCMYVCMYVCIYISALLQWKRHGMHIQIYTHPSFMVSTRCPGTAIIRGRCLGHAPQCHPLKGNGPPLPSHCRHHGRESGCRRLQRAQCQPPRE